MEHGSNSALKAIAVATGILGVEMLLCGIITTIVRGKVMESPNAEDGWTMNFFNKVFGVSTQALRPLKSNEETDETVRRWNRICSNNTANIPSGLIVLYMAATQNTLADDILVMFSWTFLIGRIGHTIMYANSLQPWRTVFYSVGGLPVTIAGFSLLTLLKN